ncbi:radial spoke head protein 9 homolog [Neodiprion pinetum]|uniref:Radial spoke head protein 9 homolog n=1 Tax=Neodiprion lecontei TaxID=441921 RepID=A0A6J0C0U2_NEOLC|nr:radial spoke head protein 9 homolog [Neodiprion lecontei]XP_046472685.1 radial spoke head protein 9 homolog [Neodiprion pinetum]XP_046610456.1 radial spoke head protein 9 homolog [Neodiprion virginianus]
MECIRLIDTLDLLGHAGVCVGTENSQLLQNSLIILQNENHFRKCYYWGRINGIQNDYHVAYGYEKECLSGRIYFYSTNCLDWLLMPKVTKCGRFLTPLAVTRFEGDPSIITNVYKANPPFPPNEDSKRHYDGPIPKELKEEDRLASLVDLINEDAFVVPRGAWFKAPNGEVIENPGFEGITLTEAQHLKSFLHGRLPQQKWNTNLLTRSDYNYAVDFLDTIDTDVPEGCWDLQFLLGCRMVTLHSLYWPGMTFYHKLNSPHYGSMYIGYGKKNLDVPFMV